MNLILLSNTIAILDEYASKVLYYDKKGNFVSDFMGHPFSEVLGLTENHIAMFTNNNISPFSNDEVGVYDMKGVKTNSFMEIPNFVKDKSISLYKQTDYFLGELLYVKCYSNDVFSVSKDGVKVKYHFDFGKHNLDMNLLKIKICNLL